MLAPGGAGAVPWHIGGPVWHSGQQPAGHALHGTQVQARPCPLSGCARCLGCAQRIQLSAAVQWRLHLGLLRERGITTCA